MVGDSERDLDAYDVVAELLTQKETRRLIFRAMSSKERKQLLKALKKFNEAEP